MIEISLQPQVQTGNIKLKKRVNTTVGIFSFKIQNWITVQKICLRFTFCFTFETVLFFHGLDFTLCVKIILFLRCKTNSSHLRWYCVHCTVHLKLHFVTLLYITLIMRKNLNYRVLSKTLLFGVKLFICLYFCSIPKTLFLLYTFTKSLSTVYAVLVSL